MSGSSIFNFESVKDLKLQVPAALLWTVASVACVEIFVRAAPDSWLYPYYSHPGFMVFMNDVVLEKSKEPKVVIMGTSRAANAIMPAEIDAALGLPEYSSANISIFGGRTSEWVDQYTHNRAKFSKLKLLIVVLDEWSFSSGVRSDEHFCLTAPWTDRLNFVQPTAMPELREDEQLSPQEKSELHEKREREKLAELRLRRNGLMADGMFNMRLKLGYVPLALAKSLHIGKKREPVFDEGHQVRSTQAETGKEAENPLLYHERINNFYKRFDTHPIFVRHVEELAALVKTHGGKLLLLQLPNRRSYQLEVEKLHPEAYAQHLRVTKELAERVGAHFEARRFPEEIGLKDADYVDYCHMAKSGTDACTKWVVELIKKEKLLE